jgi:hypothetical protein
MNDTEYCHLRKNAYGLSACSDCPISCPISSNNSNLLENAKCVMAEYEKKLG